LNLTAHTSLSPIRRGFAPSLLNDKKGCTQLAAWFFILIFIHHKRNIPIEINDNQYNAFEFEFLVFNATFSNISAISWRPILVVEEAGVTGENHQPWASNW
jgi:hypothetical protein